MQGMLTLFSKWVDSNNVNSKDDKSEDDNSEGNSEVDNSEDADSGADELSCEGMTQGLSGKSYQAGQWHIQTQGPLGWL